MEGFHFWFPCITLVPSFRKLPIYYSYMIQHSYLFKRNTMHTSCLLNATQRHKSWPSIVDIRKRSKCPSYTNVQKHMYKSVTYHILLQTSDRLCTWTRMKRNTKLEVITNYSFYKRKFDNAFQFTPIEPLIRLSEFYNYEKTHYFF